MNNYNLRNVIFTFLRKEAKIKCRNCCRVCMWDEAVCSFFTFKSNKEDVHECSKCYLKNNFYIDWFNID